MAEREKGIIISLSTEPRESEVLVRDTVIDGASWQGRIHLTVTLSLSQRLPAATAAAVAPRHTELLKKAGPAIAADQNYQAYLSQFHAADSNGESKPAVGFFLIDEVRAFFVPAEALGQDQYRFSINITNFVDLRTAVPNGSWRIVPVCGSDFGVPARIPLAQADELDNYSRNFLYDRNFAVYTVSFGLTEDDERPEVLFRTYQFSRGGGGKRKSRPWDRLRSKATRQKVLNRIYRTERRLRRKGRPVILLASEARTSLGGNLEAIYNRLIERGLDQEFVIKQHFMLPKDRSFSDRIKQVRMIAQADYLIVDDYFSSLSTLKLDPATTVIQAWHAGSGFKAVGYSRFGNYGSPKLQNPHRHYDYAIVGSKRLRHVYAEVFGIEEAAIIPTGLPRIDKFLSEEGRQEALAAFATAHPEVAGKRLILFAPTFRGRGMKDAYYDYSKIDFDALYDFCGEDTVVGFRMHHFVTEPVPIKASQADRFVDLTHYQDGLGLLQATDILVTDYSSIIYEFSLLDRPMLFYAYDRDVYSATRGFHRDYDETAPGKVCLTFDDLISALRNQDFEMEKLAKFREENFDRIDTGSTDRFIDWFLLGELPKEF